MPGMADPPRRWFRFRLRTLLLLTFVTVVGFSLYSYWSDYADQAARREREMLSPARGALCTVVLRRELLGLDRMKAQPYTSVDGVTNSVQGPFVLMNDQWIVLDGASANEPQLWIPREHVLLLMVAPR